MTILVACVGWRWWKLSVSPYNSNGNFFDIEAGIVHHVQSAEVHGPGYLHIIDIGGTSVLTYNKKIEKPILIPFILSRN